MNWYFLINSLKFSILLLNKSTFKQPITRLFARPFLFLNYSLLLLSEIARVTPITYGETCPLLVVAKKLFCLFEILWQVNILLSVLFFLLNTLDFCQLILLTSKCSCLYNTAEKNLECEIESGLNPDSEHCQTSKMKRFVKIVKGWKTLTLLATS